MWFISQGLDILPESPLLHCEYLKKAVQDLYKVQLYNIDDKYLAAQKGHFEMACKEGFLTGIAEAYYGAMLLLVGNEEQQNEAVERLKVSS